MFTAEDLADYGPKPFWFVSAETLADVLRAELRAIVRLFGKYPDLRRLFDAPETTIPQRTACFDLLVRRKIVEIIDEIFLGRYEDFPALSDEESGGIKDSQNLVTSEAPAWVLEMNEVVEWLPLHINRALPEPLRERGFYRDDPAKEEAVHSAAKTLDTVVQIQALTAQVFDEQLQRLRKRWTATLAQAGGPKRPKHWLKGLEGLVRKHDLSRYMDGLTGKQQLAFSLKYEYELPLWEIASRMGLDRKTAYEHIKAAERNINYARSSEQRKVHRGK